MKKFFKFVMGIVIAVIVLVVIGVSITAYTASKAVNAVDKTVKTIQSDTATKDKELAAMLAKAKPVVTHNDLGMDVEYTLVNDTKQSFDYIQLNADVFDKSGTKLSNDMTNITNVAAGQTFKLKLSFTEDGASSYKITSISSSPK